ncbi:MAG: BatD family protein [Chitinophagales bacterium]
MIFQRKKFFTLIILAIAIFMLFQSRLNAQTFTVTPQTVNVQQGETFNLTYLLEGDKMRNFQAPSFENFMLVSGPSRSTSVQIINGSMSQQSSVGYVLQATKEGKFTIPAGTITTKNGKTLRSKKVRINVSKSANFGKRQSRTSPQQPSQPSQRGATRNISPTSEASVWIGVVTDTTGVYQGQQITTIYRLYTNIDVTNYEILSPPSLTGFWVQDITPKHRQNPGTEIIDNVTYRTLDLKKYALFPQRSGTLPIDPMEVKVTTRYADPNGGRNMWGQPRYMSRAMNLKNENFDLSVFPLPEEGKPDDFSGAVGKFSLSATLNNPNVRENESIIYTLSVVGEGNIKLIELNDLEFPEVFEKFDPIVSEDIYPKQDKINGRKKFQYTLIPSKMGRQTIPMLEFSYFNPETKSYETARSRPITVNVSKGDGSNQIAKVLEEENKLYGLKTSTSLSKKGSYTFASWWYWPLLLLPLFAIPFFYNKTQKELAELSDVVSFKRKRANQVAILSLKKAEAFKQQGDKRNFYDEIIHALWNYLSDRFNIPSSQLSKEKIASELRFNEVSEPNVEKVLATITYCEMALFAPVADADNLEGTYKDTLDLISDIEEETSEMAKG